MFEDYFTGYGLSKQSIQAVESALMEISKDAGLAQVDVLMKMFNAITKAMLELDKVYGHVLFQAAVIAFGKFVEDELKKRDPVFYEEIMGSADVAHRVFAAANNTSEEMLKNLIEQYNAQLTTLNGKYPVSTEARNSRPEVM